MRVLEEQVATEGLRPFLQSRLLAAVVAAAELVIPRVGVLEVAEVAREGLVVVPPLVRVIRPALRPHKVMMVESLIRAALAQSLVVAAVRGRRVILTGLGTVGTAQPPLSQAHPLPTQAVVEVQQKVGLSRAVMEAAVLVHFTAVQMQVPELPTGAEAQAVHLIPSLLRPKLAAQALSSSVTQLGHSLPPAVRLRPAERTRFTRLPRLVPLP